MGEKDYPYTETKNENVGAEIALRLYREMNLDRVAVIQYDDRKPKGLQMHIVYKQERTCKHGNVQGYFTFTHLNPYLRHCEDCSIDMIQDRGINLAKIKEESIEANERSPR